MACRWIVWAGVVRRLMPHDLLPWYTMYPQSHRWLKAGVFAAIVHDLHALPRLAQGCAEVLSNSPPRFLIIASLTDTVQTRR